MGALSYRWATPADADELALLNQQLVQDGADFGPDDLEFLTRRMRGWLTDGVHQGVLFLDAQDRTVAYAIHRDNGEEIYLAQFLVVKTARGHGVGHAAIDVLRRHIWQGSKRLVLDVLVSNRHGLDFWHQMGWQDCALILESRSTLPALRTRRPPRCGSPSTPKRFARSGIPRRPPGRSRRRRDL